MKLAGLFLLMILANANIAESNETTTNKKKVRAVQEVNFADMALKGNVRNPEGAYLVQKKGLKFMSLFEVQQNLDSKIRESGDLVR